MVTVDKVRFAVVERRNVYQPKGKEWALNVIAHDRIVTLKTWQTKPAESTVADVKHLFFRSCQIYHSWLHVPGFNLTEETSKDG
jgi:hypothetical protein